METEARTRALQFINILAFVGTVVVNALSTSLPINGMDPGEISDLYPNLFVPSGLTFSIWGIIYLLLLAFCIYQFTRRGGAVAKRIGPLFLLSAAANIGWIFAWHYGFVGLSFFVMLMLLASVLAIYLRLGIGAQPAVVDLSRGEKWLAFVPFSVYLGWITVATIANATALLVDLGWNGFGLSEQFWAVLVIAAALGISVAMLITRKDTAFSLVVVWALAGIVIKRAVEDPNPIYSVVWAAAIAGGLILLAIPGVLLLRRKG